MNRLIIPSFLLLLVLCSCKETKKEVVPAVEIKTFSDIRKINQYSNITYKNHPHLKGKKIFIDPGHGGYGKEDIFRTGPTGLTEEDVNLRSSLILAEMLNQAGADVTMSRKEDIKLDLDSRIKMVKEFEPDLFLSVHHNGSARSMDNINYPCVLFWGNRDHNPASYDFASLLNSEMSKTIGVKGRVLSDYVIFWESGVKVLRKTRNICPGALVEFGYFSTADFEKKLKQYEFNVAEAESYFNAISKYFEKGIPQAAVYRTTANKKYNKRFYFLKKRSTDVYIKVDGDTDKKGIKENSLTVTVNRRLVSYEKISFDTYKLNFGEKLTPGLYRIQFVFTNHNGNSSMFYNTNLTVKMDKGEFDSLLDKAFTAIEAGNYLEGLELLLPLYYYCSMEPVGGKVAYYIALASEKLGELQNAAYYYNRAYHFYPDSPYREKIKNPYITDPRFRIDNYGKTISTKYVSSESKVKKLILNKEE